MSNSASFTIEEDVQRLRDEIFQLRLDHAILVEGKSDEPFWEHLWGKVAPGRYKIYAYVHYPAAGASGKNTLVHHYLPYGGRDFLLCLDADYDYLLKAAYLQQPYVLHTYVYAIENFQCFLPALLLVLRQNVQSETATFNFEMFFQRYNQLAYRWLLHQLYQHYSANVEIGRPPVFSTITNAEQDLDELISQKSTEFDLSRLEQDPAFQSFQQELASLGLNAQNAYLFIRGHNLLDSVVLKLLKWVAKPISKQEFAWRTAQERAQYYQYQKQNAFEELLQKHYRYEGCDFYTRLLADANAAIEPE